MTQNRKKNYKLLFWVLFLLLAGLVSGKRTADGKLPSASLYDIEELCELTGADTPLEIPSVKGAVREYNLMTIGSRATIKKPEEAAFADSCRFRSNHPEIVSVTKKTGKVTAHSAGKAVVTLRYTINGTEKKAKCYIEVTDPSTDSLEISEPTTPSENTSPIDEVAQEPEPTKKPSAEATISITEDEIRQKLMELEEEYPDGAYWNHVGTSFDYSSSTESIDMVTTISCPNHHSYKRTCNRWLWDKSTPEGVTPSKEIYAFGYQCAGYAFMLSDKIFGEENDILTAYYRDPDSIRVGDYIRYNNNTHSAIVTDVFEDYVIVTDCNGTTTSHPCQISWNKKVTKDTLVRTSFYGLSRY